MAGIYLDDNKTKISVQNWVNTIIAPSGNWRGNNLHIDEIESLCKIRRPEWINASFAILNILPSKVKSSNSLLLFLHIDLKYSPKRMLLEQLSFDWLNKNVSKYTPPSLNLTSFEYYTDFYEKELIACKPDNSIIKLIKPIQEWKFYYRTYYDKDERLYSREIYIFI